VLVLVFLWASYLLQRYFDAFDFAFGDGRLFPSAGHGEWIFLTIATSALLATFVNLGLPILLTTAFLRGLDVDPAVVTWDFVTFVWGEVGLTFAEPSG
jgi:hypothetical protein